MKIHTTLNIGSFHTNHCEDFLVSEAIGSGIQLIAVMDGCTMGNESVFASILTGKILRNISKRLFYQDFIAKSQLNLEAELKEVLRSLFETLRSQKNQLGLETNELLSTLIIGVVDSVAAEATFITVGDGLIFHDGISISYDQDDKPDYLGYHLSEDFEQWYRSNEQKLSIKGFKDLSICTDGIFTFRNFENPAQQKSEQEIIDFLLKDKEGFEDENFLPNKVLELKSWKHVVTDDLAIVRLVL